MLSPRDAFTRSVGAAVTAWAPSRFEGHPLLVTTHQAGEPDRRRLEASRRPPDFAPETTPAPCSTEQEDNLTGATRCACDVSLAAWSSNKNDHHALPLRARLPSARSSRSTFWTENEEVTSGASPAWTHSRRSNLATGLAFLHQPRRGYAPSRGSPPTGTTARWLPAIQWVLCPRFSNHGLCLLSEIALERWRAAGVSTNRAHPRFSRARSPQAALADRDGGASGPAARLRRAALRHRALGRAFGIWMMLVLLWSASSMPPVRRRRRW